MKRGIRDLVYIAFSASLIAIFSQFIIPLPSGVPLTLQTFMVALTGYVIGFKGSIAVLIYIAIGAVGVPVFTGFQGGLGTLFGITGGFIIGFIPLAFFCGIEKRKIHFKIIFGLIGIILCHVLGVIRFSEYSGDIKSAFFAVSLPYIVKDIVSVTLAAVISRKIKRAISAYVI